MIYDVGAYPALVIEEEGEVIGEWFTVTKEGLQAMDELEEYEEGSQYNEYERVWVKDIEQPIKGSCMCIRKAKR